MNFKELEKILFRDGWILKEVRGSHHYYIHPKKTGKVTIPRHGNGDLNIKTMKTILKQAGIIIK